MGWVRSFCVDARALVSLLAFILLLPLAGCGRNEEENQVPDPHWASFPVPLRVDEDLLDGRYANEDLLSAISFWETRARRQLFALGNPWPHGVLPYSGLAANPNGLLDNVIFFQSPWPQEWEARVAGKTIIHSTSSLIAHAVIFLNAETRLCPALCIDEADSTSRRKLLAHELGHFLGFAHVNDPQNIMYPEIQQGGYLDNLKIDEGRLRALVPTTR